MISFKELIKLLNEKGYEYRNNKHKALFTVSDSIKLRGEIKGSHSKNLFLKNKKNNFYLISCNELSEIKLKYISKSLGMGNVSFAREEYLLDLMGVKPGSVTPFGLLNNTDNKIELYLEESLYSAELVNFHPLINTATITMSSKDFVDFMIENKKKIHIFSLETGKIIKSYGC